MNTTSSHTQDWPSTVRLAFERGEPAVICDDTEEHARAALIFPASSASPSLVNRCLHLSGGASSQVALSPLRTECFQLEPMGFNRVLDGTRKGDTARELVSVEARHGVTTGISAADRATTIQVLGAANPVPRELVKPGHIFPIRTREGGTLVRSAIPEAALDVVRMCAFSDAAAFFEIFSSDGSYLSSSEIETLADNEKLIRLQISQLIAHRLQTERLVEKITEVKLPTRYQSDMKAYLYRSKVYQGDHIAIVKGNIDGSQSVLTRVHPENTFQDVFGPSGENKGTPLERALSAIGASEVGVLVYLRRPDKQPLSQELRQESATPRSRGAAMREYGLGAQILRDLGVREIDLLSSSGAPPAGLATYGLRIVSQRPLGDESLKRDER